MTRRKKSARLAPYHFTGKKKEKKKERKKEKENISGQVFFANTSTTITKTNKKTNLMDLPDADDSRLRKTRSICSIEMRKKKKKKKENVSIDQDE